MSAGLPLPKIFRKEEEGWAYLGSVNLNGEIQYLKENRREKVDKHPVC